ncbi:MAG TPA: potassium channel family protein [Gemmatimonadaceae bacterium]|nr:potassium channel family protein [Gemmatimonadaceae bacterium]
MSGAATVASNVGGAVLVLAVLWDMFRELYHPAGTGSLTRTLRDRLWRLFRRAARRRRKVLQLAGPTMVIAIIATWGVLLTLGWALIFWPYLPDAFRFASGLEPVARSGFGTAMYFSALSLTTLGVGDVTPTWTSLRLLCNVEAAIGFALLTAGISWILSIYPVLARRRTLARRVFLLHSAGAKVDRALTELDPVVAAPVVGELAVALAQVRVDLVQSGITYYFGDGERAGALAAALPLLARLADDGLAPGRADAVRHAAAGLHVAVRDFAETVRTTYLRMPERPLGDVLARYAEDHRCEPPAP